MARGRQLIKLYPVQEVTVIIIYCLFITLQTFSIRFNADPSQVCDILILWQKFMMLINHLVSSLWVGANPSSNHKAIFIDKKFFQFNNHMILVQNPHNEVYISIGQQV